MIQPSFLRLTDYYSFRGATGGAHNGHHVIDVGMSSTNAAIVAVEYDSSD